MSRLNRRIKLVILFGFNTNAHGDGPPPPPPEAQLTAYPYYIDFSNVNIGSTSEQTLTLVNEGNLILTINQITPPTSTRAIWYCKRQLLRC